MFKTFPNYDAFQGVAVNVFKTQNLEAIRSLKKFLMALPSPSYIRMALLQAVYHLAEEDPDVCRWILQNRHHLEPELNLMEVTQQVVIGQLQSQGLSLNQDFKFTLNGQLDTTESINAALLTGVSLGDRLLIEEILFIC
ncbi:MULTISPECIES: hypothetical protein [Nostoc]|uniref:Uncharacterized protein n=2 Tax=Nostoc TaxID=1177 RepID=A0ABR8IHK9_9NOSO|nr:MULTISPECIES: hypothetical protein [Nostoc]MBD2564963.1 hypothetical protein [Nostoc linckia FACHB-391]MBD2651084.1 hypothetical protein [Nostoc foliaceum FACHB-393]